MKTRYSYFLLVLITLFIFNLAYAFKVRYGDHKDFYRVVFQTDKEVFWKLKEFKKDNIIVLTLKDKYEGKVNLLEKELNRSLKGYTREIKIVKNGEITKIILKLKPNVKARAFKLNEPYRIVIDLKRFSKVSSKPKKSVEDIIASLILSGEKPKVKPKPKAKAKSSVKQVKKKRAVNKKTKIAKKKKSVKKRLVAKRKAIYRKKRRNRKIVVVIDPGHGGRDPGATANGLREKDINLRIARRIKFYLERDGRFRVYLTRNRDVFIPLRKRSLIAVEKNADLFISIHCNSLERNRRWTGTYVYTLNLRGAKSKLARIVENRENKRVIRFVRVSSNKYVNRIVADLAISSTMVEGRRFARHLRRKLRYVTKVRKIESANFMVLKTPGIPSVLIETLFITSPRDAKKLRNWHFRDRFSHAVYEAVVDYFF